MTSPTTASAPRRATPRSTPLASLTHRAHIGHLIATTHGAAFAALDDDGLVLPMVDYEFDAYADQREAYALAVGDLRETASPHLPMGLNAARPWYWQAREFPAAFWRARTLLPYPQYWAWRLSGIAASEVSSLGCHTHLWSPVSSSWSRLVRREEWAQRFAPSVRPGKCWARCGLSWRSGSTCRATAWCTPACTTATPASHATCAAGRR